MRYPFFIPQKLQQWMRLSALGVMINPLYERETLVLATRQKIRHIISTDFCRLLPNDDSLG